MYYHSKKREEKANYYPGRGLVLAVQVLLIGAIAMIVVDKAVEHFVPTVGDGNASQVAYYEAAPSSAMSANDYWEMGLYEQVYDSDNFEAVRYYTQALELDPQHSFSLLNRGVAYESMGHVANATQDYADYIRSYMSNYYNTNIEMGEQVRLTIEEGTAYYVMFEGQAGQSVSISARAVTPGSVDPLLVLMNHCGSALTSDDDIRLNGELLSADAHIDGYELPADGTYYLIVTHAGNGPHLNAGDIVVRMNAN